jgi:hypothetical protein
MIPLQRWGPLLRIAAAIAAVLSAAAVAVAASPQLLLSDVHGRTIDPLQPRAGVKATVFLFTSTECPVSNRYAPDVQQLYEKFGSHGVTFWLVYPNPAESADAIRRHQQEYGYTMEALRDPQHALVKHVGATVTPEAAVIDAHGHLVYRGRIDDRYVDVTRQRPAATRHDLDDAVAAVLAGRRVSETTTQAVGCYIADFRP